MSLPVDGEFALKRMQNYTQRADQMTESETATEDFDFQVKDADLALIVEQLASPLPKYRDTGAFFS